MAPIVAHLIPATSGAQIVAAATTNTSSVIALATPAQSLLPGQTVPYSWYHAPFYCDDGVRFYYPLRESCKSEFFLSSWSSWAVAITIFIVIVAALFLCLFYPFTSVPGAENNGGANQNRSRKPKRKKCSHCGCCGSGGSCGTCGQLIKSDDVGSWLCL